MWSYFILMSALLWRSGSALTVNSCSDNLPRDAHLTVFQNKCYYFYLNVQRGFEEAQHVCEEKGGNLASIKTQTVNNFIWNKLKNDYRFHGNVWIGLVGKDLNGKVQWGDETKHNTCYTLETSTGKLIVFDCMNIFSIMSVRISFVCEFPPKEVPVSSSSTTYQCPASIPENKYRKILDNTCYYFHFDDKLTSPKAQAECRRKGGNLVSIKTPKIQDFIWKTLKDTYKFEGDVWIGLGDKKNEGHFVWTDGSTMDYQNFRRDESRHHTRQDCVNMYAKTGEWFDNPCSNYVFSKKSSKSYICEFPAIAISRQLPASTKATTQPPHTKQQPPHTPLTPQTTTTISRFPVKSTPAVTKTKFECPSSLPHDKYLDILDKDCFYFHFDNKLDFPDAQTVCKEQGGNLAAIKTENVQNVLWKKLQNTYQFEGDVWIGLGDERSGDVFEWRDGSKMTYENFDNKTSTRSKTYGLWHNCVAMNAKSGKWFDDVCGPIGLPTNEKYFICQFSAVQKRLEKTTSTPPPTRTTTTTPPPPPPTTTTTTKATTTISKTPPSTETPTAIAKTLNTTIPITHTVPSKAHTSSKTTTTTTTTTTTKTTTPITDGSLRNSSSSNNPITTTTNAPATSTVSRNENVSAQPRINQTDTTKPNTGFEQTTKPTANSTLSSHSLTSPDSTSAFPKDTTTPNVPTPCPVCKLDCGDNGFTTDFIKGCIICKCL